MIDNLVDKNLHAHDKVSNERARNHQLCIENDRQIQRFNVKKSQLREILAMTSKTQGKISKLTVTRKENDQF